LCPNFVFTGYYFSSTNFPLDAAPVSTVTASAATSGPAAQAFDKITVSSGSNFWGVNSFTCPTAAVNTYCTYSGTASTKFTDGTTYSGAWIQVKLNTSVVLFGYKLYSRNICCAARTPAAFVVSGSNDGTNWYKIDTRTNINTYTMTTPYTGVATPWATQPFLYYRLSVNKINNFPNGDALGELNLGEMELLGASLSVDVPANATVCPAGKYCRTDLVGSMVPTNCTLGELFIVVVV
jgi:hypothetical protein